MSDEQVQAEDKASGEKTTTEEFKVAGDQIMAKIKELVHEGNVRRITVKNDQGATLVVIPLTMGVVGAILLPIWAAVAAGVALVTNCSITVERKPESL